MFGPTSFRRILLSRILLLSVPVLAIGQYVTYRKARSSLLETARQNLTESAVRKSNSIYESVNALKVSVSAASEAAAIKSGSPSEAQAFLDRFVKSLPPTVRCVEVADLQAERPIASTCDRPIFEASASDYWASRVTASPFHNNAIYVSARVPDPIAADIDDETDNPRGETYLNFSAPVYVRADDGTDALRYALTLRSILYRPNEPKNRPGSLTGSTVAIDSNGIVLEHPIPSQVGLSVDATANSQRLRDLIGSALAGNQNFLHLFAFESDTVELLAGYTAMPSPLTTGEEGDRWVILAVTHLDDALAGLEPIRQVMFNLVLGLLAANLIATLYLARDLARPVEQLGEYARNVECNTASEPIPESFFIHEFNQLATALNRTIERLKSWAQELEAAWKEAKTANQLKSEFLTTISHELRTPLNGIIGSVRLVRDGFCDNKDEERDFLQRADDAAVHLLGIINDILDISKIEAGTLTVAIETVDLHAILQEAIDLYAAAIREKGLELNLCGRSDDERSLWVRADAGKLKQVCLNALSNAVKFTDTGKISISTRIELDEPESENAVDRRAVVEISDTGIGVEPADFDKLFEPFVTIDGSRTRRFGGTGLGLAISRNLMEMMHGSISLYSEGVGRGATVTLTIPLAQRAPSSSTADVGDRANC
ncbi:HAMP domain-containing sensor histidine kinase [Geitlerinema sp. CS-897]|nr:HAMP domain-containing sensor histidine kinase [Geitlerinema sp. CS-897]